MDSSSSDNEDVKTEPEKMKPGQRYPTPSPGVAERIFYETLYEQMPDSPMAQEWCVLYGILPEEEAAKLAKVVAKRKAEAKANGGFSPSPVKKKKKVNGDGEKDGHKKKKKKKKVVLHDDAEADTGLGRSSVYEGVGTGGV